MVSFNPSAALMKPTAKILAGTIIDGDLIRFKAQVSNLSANGAEVNAALAAAFDGNASIIESAIFEKASGQAGTSIIEGFAIARPQSYVFDGSIAEAMVEMASLTGLHPKETAGNMYMDENEQVWAVTHAGGTTVITREDCDDVAELLASANTVATKSQKLQLAVSQSARGMVRYVSRDGVMTDGFVYAAVEGDSNKVEVAEVTDSHGKRTEVVDLAQIVAYVGLDPKTGKSKDFGDNDPMLDPKLFNRDGSVDLLEYYRILYSNDPTIMEELEALIG